MVASAGTTEPEGAEPDPVRSATPAAAPEPVGPAAEPDLFGSGTPAPAPASEPVEALAGAEPEAIEATEDDEGDEGEAGPYVDELFARIRAGRPGSGGAAPEATAVAEAVAVAVPEDEADDEPEAGDEPEAERGREVEDDPEVVVLRERDAVLAAVERELGRRLKRVLADEQNEVFDLLRRGRSVTFADVVPAGDEHADRFAIAATPDLEAAAAHGASRVGGDLAVSCDDLAGSLGRSLVDPLRHRIERSFDDCDGDMEEVTERLRALYREWKGQHIGAAVRHYTAAAYAWGAYDAAPEGAKLRWLVDRTGESCPDADDNALAGPVAKGTPVPHRGSLLAGASRLPVPGRAGRRCGPLLSRRSRPAPAAVPRGVAERCLRACWEPADANPGRARAVDRLPGHASP